MKDRNTSESDDFRLTELEARILRKIEGEGWYPGLWLPVVNRDMLDFGSDASDEALYAAFASLVRKRALISTNDNPEWALAPGAFESAIRTLSRLRGPVGVQGYRLHSSSPHQHFDKRAGRYIAGDHWHLFEVKPLDEVQDSKCFWQDVGVANSFPPAPDGAVPVTSIDLSRG